MLALLLAATAAEALAATYKEQREQLREASDSLRSCERFLRSKRTDEAVTAYRSADERLKEVAGDLHPRSKKAYRRAVERLAALRAKLIEAGATLPALPPNGTGSTGSSAGSPGGTRPGIVRGVSFTRQVAPLLASKCGQCHIDNTRGGFSLATFQQLMAASVVEPGDGMASSMMDLIVSGDMPRGGGRVSPAEARMLLTWINEGAKFDGDSPTNSLRGLKPSGAGATEAGSSSKPNASRVPRPTGAETVSFSAEVAPLLLKRCGECHVSDSRGGFDAKTFEQLFASGAVQPRNADASTLVRRVRGDEDPRMPLRRTPLSKEEIALITTWINEGASFDGKQLGGSAAGEPLKRVAELATVTRADRDELNKMRLGFAERHWRTALSDQPAAMITTDHFLMMGAMPPTKLEALGGLAERSVDQVAKFFRDDQPRLGKSRVSLFVFDDRLDYAEFGTMVERRQLPSGVEGHWRHDLVDPYACVMSSSVDSETDAFLVTQQVAALVMAARSDGRAPAWLVDGASRAIAAQLHSNDARPKSWKKQIPELARGLENPTDFTTEKLSPEPRQILSYGFAQPLLRKPRDFAKLLDMLSDGKEPKEAIRRVYGRPLEELTKVWIAAVSRQR